MKLIKQYLLLMLVCLSLLTYVIALQSDIPTELAVLAASGLTLVLAWVLERKLPYRKEWGESQGDLSVDLASAGVIIGLVDPLLKAVAPLAVVAMYASAGVGPLLLKQPLWLEIIFVLLAVEFGKYWAHRLHHQLGALWWLHAMHHSSERLYFLNGLRFHPLNYTLNFVIAVLPVMLLGVSPEALIAYLAITQPVVLPTCKHRFAPRLVEQGVLHTRGSSLAPFDGARGSEPELRQCTVDLGPCLRYLQTR